jgi:hypothetical protein
MEELGYIDGKVIGYRATTRKGVQRTTFVSPEGTRYLLERSSLGREVLSPLSTERNSYGLTEHQHLQSGAEYKRIRAIVQDASWISMDTLTPLCSSAAAALH